MRARLFKLATNVLCDNAAGQFICQELLGKARCVGGVACSGLI